MLTGNLAWCQVKSPTGRPRIRDRLKDLQKRWEDGAISPQEFDVEVRKANAEAEVEESWKEQQEETPKCWNCDGEFSQTTSVIRDFDSCWPGLALLRAILKTLPNELPWRPEYFRSDSGQHSQFFPLKRCEFILYEARPLLQGYSILGQQHLTKLSIIQFSVAVLNKPFNLLVSHHFNF